MASPVGAISNFTTIAAPTGAEIIPAVYAGTAVNYNITANVFRTWLLASSALTGTPTAPTAAQNTNTTQVASTAFVLGQATAATPLMNGTAAVGTTTLFARGDHVHPTDTTRAASGANSDITSLSGLTTPLSSAQGGTGNAGGVWPAFTPAVVFTGGTGTSITDQGSSALLEGKKLYFHSAFIVNYTTAPTSFSLTVPLSKTARLTAVLPAANFSTGLLCQATVNASTSLGITKYDGTLPVTASGQVLVVSGLIEVS